ncbi:mRNA turnover and ribosome assembly protein [Sorochytrium milnesiophthora]
MPQSKRQKVVSLTKTEKHGRANKEQLVTDIRAAADSYAYVFVFSVANMRNALLKEVRSEWNHSRFFFGKTKVMQRALGLDGATEIKDNISQLTQKLSGSVGLLFTNVSPEDTVAHFKSFAEADYARSGNRATETVVLPEGPVVRGFDKDPFPHNMEPQLRKLGLPTKLNKGVVTLLRDHTLVKKGAVLTPEQAQLLKLFHIQQAVFRVYLLCYYDVSKAEVVDVSAEFPDATSAAEGGDSMDADE